jgi:hypothetical protein
MTATAPPARPTPFPRGEERDYFAAARDGRLVYQKCAGCARVVFYPRAVCPFCGATELRLLDSAGIGTVYSFTVQHRPGHPFFADSLPSTLVLVDLDEDFRVLTDLVDADDVRIGMRVQVVFDDVTEDLTLPRFRPCPTAEESR